MPSITRTKQETVVTVTATNRKIRLIASKELTIEESRELRGLLKAEERKAESQTETIWTSGGYYAPVPRFYNYDRSI